MRLSLPKSQAGLTLLISIILLAVVTFVSFSLATVILREIVAARLLLHTEPALSGANAGGEVALFRMMRELGGTGAEGTLAGSGAEYKVTPKLYDDPYPFTVPCTAAELQVALYDAENTNNKEANYGSVTVNYTSGACTLKIEIFSWSSPNINLCPQNLVSGQNTTCTALTGADGDDRYVISIQPQGGTGNAVGTILTKANDLATNRGVPSASPDFDVVGSSGTVQRKINIKLSN